MAREFPLAVGNQPPAASGAHLILEEFSIMALSEADKSRVIEMLDSLGSEEADAVLESQNSFTGWLKSAAWWLWERIKNNIGYIFDAVVRFFCGGH